MTTPELAARQGRVWNINRPRFRRLTLADLPAGVGTVVAAVGLLALVGWFVGSDALKAMLPGGMVMKANTAICFVLMGLGLYLVSRTVLGSRGRSAAIVLVVAAAAIALLTGAQYLIGRDLGFDQLLFHEAPGTLFPGRMSPLTAICLVLLALAVVLASVGNGRRLVLAICGGSIALSVLMVVNYAFGAAAPAFFRNSTLMAANTAVVLSVLGIGVLGLLGPASPFALLVGPSATAMLLRRLLAISLVVPVVMGWLRLEGERLGLYDTSYGTSLMIVGSMSIIVVAILHSARWAHELEMKRKASELERDRFFELSPDMLSVIGVDGRFQRVNRGWESVLGYAAGEIVGKSFTDFVHPGDLELTVAAVKRHHSTDEYGVSFQNRYRHRDGSYRWLEWMSQASPDGSVAFGIARDITDRKLAEDRQARQQRALESRNEALNERTLRDPLTGLHNRRFFDAEIARLERRWGRQPISQRAPVSVVMFDLDNFGLLNNQHGHQAGDAVLRLFAGLLRKRFRESDVVARYGGEEFVAVLEGATSDDAIQIAEDIRTAFERASVDIGTGTPLHCTVSAGVAALDDERNASAGLSLADVWLSQAKRAGRNQVLGL